MLNKFKLGKKQDSSGKDFYFNFGKIILMFSFFCFDEFKRINSYFCLQIVTPTMMLRSASLGLILTQQESPMTTM